VPRACALWLGLKDATIPGPHIAPKVFDNIEAIPSDHPDHGKTAAFRGRMSVASNHRFSTRDQGHVAQHHSGMLIAGRRPYAPRHGDCAPAAPPLTTSPHSAINRRMYCFRSRINVVSYIPDAFRPPAAALRFSPHYGHTEVPNVGLEVIKTLLKGHIKARYTFLHGGRFAPRWIETGAHMLPSRYLVVRANMGNAGAPTEPRTYREANHEEPRMPPQANGSTQPLL